MPTMIIATPSPWNRLHSQVEMRENPMKIFAFSYSRILRFHIFLVVSSKIMPEFQARRRSCVRACVLLSHDFGFYSLSNVNHAAWLLRNVKQAEENILHLLPFAFYACLIKNDFYAADLSFSVLLYMLEIMTHIPLPFTSPFPMCSAHCAPPSNDLICGWTEKKILAFTKLIMHGAHTHTHMAHAIMSNLSNFFYRCFKFQRRCVRTQSLVFTLDGILWIFWVEAFGKNLNNGEVCILSKCMPHSWIHSQCRCLRWQLNSNTFDPRTWMFECVCVSVCWKLLITFNFVIFSSLMVLLTNFLNLIYIRIFCINELICCYYLCAVVCFVCVVRQFSLIESMNLIKSSVIWSLLPSYFYHYHENIQLRDQFIYISRSWIC